MDNEMIDCHIGSCQRHQQCMYTPCRRAEAGMLDENDFPLVAYGAAIFAATNPAPICVLPTAALAADMVRRINEGEIAARICDAVALEGGDYAWIGARQCARLIRGRIEAENADVMAAAHAPPEPVEPEGWGAPKPLDPAVNRDTKAG